MFVIITPSWMILLKKMNDHQNTKGNPWYLTMATKGRKFISLVYQIYYNALRTVLISACKRGSERFSPSSISA